MAHDQQGNIIPDGNDGSPDKRNVRPDRDFDRGLGDAVGAPLHKRALESVTVGACYALPFTVGGLFMYWLVGRQAAKAAAASEPVIDTEGVVTTQ
jgi:hypothetical protein